MRGSPGFPTSVFRQKTLKALPPSLLPALADLRRARIWPFDNRSHKIHNVSQSIDYTDINHRHLWRFHLDFGPFLSNRIELYLFG